MAPRSDSSASMLCRGTRLLLGGAGAARRVRVRVSSKAWTTVPQLCSKDTVGNESNKLGIRDPELTVWLWTTTHSLWRTLHSLRHGTMVVQGCDTCADPSGPPP